MSAPTDYIDACEPEMAFAQAAIDLHPDASPFWDSDDGQEALRISRRCGLVARTTNRERCRLHSEAMRSLGDGAELGLHMATRNI